MPMIRAQHAYKIFGDHPGRARALLEAGASKDEVQQRTGHVVAVQDASFEVERGELFVIMGLSGSGKSTLVRLLNRLHEPTFGTIEIAGQDIGRLGAKALRQVRSTTISMVFQRFALLPHRSVLDNAAYGLEVQRVAREEREERARESLARVGLTGWEASYPRELSGGMQQRVGLARALATDADVLLMDEPFGALDPLIRRNIQLQLLELQEELGKTIVFITHDLNEAMLLGDRIAVMKDGCIIQIGTAEDLITRPGDSYVAAFTHDVDRSRVLTASSIMREPVAVLSLHDTPRTAAQLMDEVDRDELYVLGRERKVLGYVRNEDVLRLPHQGERRLAEVLRSDHPRTSGDTVIGELFGLAAAHPMPIAVVDPEERLLGVVRRPLLLAAATQPTPSEERAGA
jgi:glycine betaine/proline transport system ATP-binding protein